jgi:predicted peptidase
MPIPTGFLFEALNHAGREYKYALYVPRDYDPGKPWPLIVFLNGRGECGTDGSKQLAIGLGPAMMFHPEEWPFLVLFPQKPDPKDQWEDHDETVMAMVQQTQNDYTVEESRLYLTGLSQGGHGTWTIGSRHPDLWAALAPICGYGKPDEIAPALAEMPIWCFHGDADTAVPVSESENLVAAVRKAGGSPQLTIYPGVGHNSWDKAYREEGLAAWLLSHQRK